MEKVPNIDIEKLKEAIETAEKVLEEIKDDDSRKKEKKRKRINKALEKAYELLNRDSYTQKEVDKRTDDIWIALMDDDHFLALIVFFFGFVLSGTILYAVFQAYSFIQTNWDPDTKQEEFTQDLAEQVKVNYVETSVVSLYDQMSVSDQKGLQNPPQEFTIENDSTTLGNINYRVNYSVNIVPLNDPNAKLIDKKYIKYKYFYKDSKDGKTYESKVGTLDELKVNDDGSILLTTGIQDRDTKTDFKVIFWISSHATNKEQGASYTMQFKVNAAIARS